MDGVGTQTGLTKPFSRFSKKRFLSTLILFPLKSHFKKDLVTRLPTKQDPNRRISHKEMRPSDHFC